MVNSMSDDLDKMNKWLATWDKHAEKFAREQTEEMAKRIEKQQQTSFFNDRPSTNHWQDKDELIDDQGWGNLINRSTELDYNGENEQILTEEEDGFRHLVKGATPGSDKVSFQQNPQRPWSIGNDQEGEDGHVRVTPNWTDGNELLTLDKIKRDIEAMERRVHESQVIKKKNDRVKLESELKSLRTRVKQLSEKLQPLVDKDVT
jgi:hypothetical protein